MFTFENFACRSQYIWLFQAPLLPELQLAANDYRALEDVFLGDTFGMKTPGMSPVLLKLGADIKTAGCSMCCPQSSRHNVLNLRWRCISVSRLVSGSQRHHLCKQEVGMLPSHSPAALYAQHCQHGIRAALWLNSVMMCLNCMMRQLMAAMHMRAPGAFTKDDVERYKQAFARPGSLTAVLNYYRAIIDAATWAPPTTKRHVRST